MKPMMNDLGLLGCPFCGQLKDVFIYRTPTYGNYRVACGDCEVESGMHCTEEAAIKAWNTRNGHLYTADDYKQDAMERANGL